MKCANCGKGIEDEQSNSVTLEASEYKIAFCNLDCLGKAVKRTTRLMKKIGVKRLSIRLEKASKSNGGGTGR